MGRMVKVVAVWLPEALYEGVEELVKRGKYPSKSDAVRFAIRDLLRKEGIR